MVKAKLYASDEAVGPQDFELEEGIFGATVNADLLYRTVRAQLLNSTSGDELDQIARRGARRRPEALAAKRNGPCSCRVAPFASLGWRWCHLRPETAYLPCQTDKEDAPPGAYLCALRPRQRRKDRPSGSDDVLRSPKGPELLLLC